MARPRPDTGPTHYVAGGTRVPLRAAPDLIAANSGALSQDSIGNEALNRPATALPGGYLLFQADQLTEQIRARLEQAGLTQPVYRADGAILVALPEIRIESEDDERLEELAKSLGESKRVVVQRSLGRLSVTVVSGDGGESLALANSLAEKYPGLSVTPRFLRIVERSKG